MPRTLLATRALVRAAAASDPTAPKPPARPAARRSLWGEGPGTGRRAFPCPSEPAPSSAPSTAAASTSTAHPMLTAAEVADLFARAGAGSAPTTPDGGPPPGQALLAEAREGPASGRRVRPPVAAGPPGKGTGAVLPRVPARPCDDAEEALRRELKGRRGC